MRRAGLAAALVLTVPLAAGCGLSLSTLPAPAGISGPTYRVTAQFADVGDLTIGAKVKLQGVVIGQVQTITTKNFQANVAIDLETKFRLPVGSTFQIRFTTPLGEDFVSVTAPTAAPRWCRSRAPARRRASRTRSRRCRSSSTGAGWTSCRRSPVSWTPR
jgi:ABC-type transporter Mla subunit MlaD